MKKDLFQPVVPPEKRHEYFEKIRTWPGSEPGRVMANEIFQSFPSREGNFIEQFQTTGLDARIFELYLYAYFLRSGFGILMFHKQPDFFVTRNQLTVAVEATTVNPSGGSGEPIEAIPRKRLTPEQIMEKGSNELPIKFGGPLFDKLKNEVLESKALQGAPSRVCDRSVSRERCAHVQ